MISLLATSSTPNTNPLLVSFTTRTWCCTQEGSYATPDFCETVILCLLFIQPTTRLGVIPPWLYALQVKLTYKAPACCNCGIFNSMYSAVPILFGIYRISPLCWQPVTVSTL